MSIDSIKNNKLHAFGDDLMGTRDGLELAAMLRRREISQLELTRVAIERCRKLNPLLQSYCYERFDAALAEARSSVPGQTVSGAFAGVPTFVKDNVQLAGLPTGFGSAALKPAVEKRSAAYAKQFLSLGVSVLGKSTLPEFGFNATTEPEHGTPTRNPWHTGHSAGASSGGAAVLVASGAVPFAHGNDGGGSIRIPAACNGLVGLKPSRGRHVNSMQARSLPINIVSEGILSRSIRDTAHFHFEAQSYYHNPGLPLLPLVQGPAKKRLKIGLISDSVNGQATDADTRAVLEHTANLLVELGHQVDEADFPVGKQFADDFSLYWGMMAFAVKHSGRLSINRSFDASRLDSLSLGLANYYKKRMIKTPAALFRLAKAGQDFRTSFEDYDLLLSPVLSRVTPPLGYLSPSVPFEELFTRLMAYVGFTPMANVAGTPAISLPMGMSATGLPIGLQFSADRGQEQTLLELAFELEAAKGWPLLNSGE